MMLEWKKKKKAHVIIINGTEKKPRARWQWRELAHHPTYSHVGTSWRTLSTHLGSSWF